MATAIPSLIKNSETDEQSSIYALKLESDKYYIGMTSNFERRYQQHVSGNGAKWTQRYKVLEILVKFETSKKYAPCEETKLTCKFMDIYGYQNVRGAEYAEDRNYTIGELKRISFACKHHLSTEEEDS